MELNEIKIIQNREESISPVAFHNIYLAVKNIGASKVDLLGTISVSAVYDTDINYLAGKINGVVNPDGIFPNLNVYPGSERLIEFKDNEVLRVLTASTSPLIDTNRDGMISINEAQAVTSLPSFMGNKNIESFGELGAFIKVTSLPYQAFRDCEKLKFIDLTNIKVLPMECFRNTSTLNTDAFLEIEKLNSYTFQGSKIEGTLRMPNLKSLGAYEIFQSNIKAVIDLGIATNFPDHCIASNGALKVLIVPSTTTALGDFCFERNDNLKVFACKSIEPPTIHWGALTNNSKMNYIFVPSSSVDAYKSAGGWSSYASKIFAIGGAEYQAAAQVAAEEEGVDVSGMDLSDENIFEYIYTHLPE